jgi:dipeptidyl aminopeptidase/acylaminoacyl peptidase
MFFGLPAPAAVPVDAYGNLPSIEQVAPSPVRRSPSSRRCRTGGCSVNDSGDIVAERDYFENERRWSIRLFNGGHTHQTISGIAAIDAPDILGLSAREDALIVALTEPAGTVWKPLLLSDGTWGPELAGSESVTELLLKEGSQRMIGTGFVGESTRYHFSDPDVQPGCEWTERVFGFQRVRFVSASADYSKFIVGVMGPKSGYAYFVSDVKEHLTVPIGKIYAGVTEIAEVRPVKYRTGNGLEIPPTSHCRRAGPAKNLPVVILPHGCPQARDRLDFDWWAQALAYPCACRVTAELPRI